MSTTFIPRATFPVLTSLPKSYFLGHHAAALTKMKSLISTTDLVIECRDYRLPLTSRNPLFEVSLASKPRLVIYMSKDIGRSGLKREYLAREDLIREWNYPARVQFVEKSSGKDMHSVLRYLSEFAIERQSLVPATCLVVGMPNMGKSTLLNALRKKGKLGTKKVAKTGAEPGVTRKISTAVKIVEGLDEGGSVYVLDTPGVFVPYMPDQESMLKLALCGNVKDALVPASTLADYVLFRINQFDPSIYKEYCPPTNNVFELLEKIANKMGRIKRGGELDLEAAAVWVVQRWRIGQMGKFVLDDVSPDGLQLHRDREAGMLPSMNQARKAAKEAIVSRSKSREVEVY